MKFPDIDQNIVHKQKIISYFFLIFNGRSAGKNALPFWRYKIPLIVYAPDIIKPNKVKPLREMNCKKEIYSSFSLIKKEGFLSLTWVST
ncbi:hypothetical protein [Sulfurovum sp. TSL6]|uniref:hypothetical protein n=1 Tax=Sulfurovum sp. TSL6 TaxID=2826995 RepID=UPI001CC3A855|nr:hypothetical protein [Sulfurovum sp. TSL6]